MSCLLRKLWLIWSRTVDHRIGRTDEDQLGITYDEIEWAMNVAENNLTPSDPLSEKVYERFLELRKANMHKMHPIPVCKIKSKIRS